MRTRAWLGIVGLLLVSAPVGHAATTMLAPPFSDVLPLDFCDGLVLSSCESSASADAAAGTFAFEVEVESPAGGIVPWRGSGDAGAYFRKVGAITGASTMDIAVTLRIDRAIAEFGSLLADAGSPVTGYARVYVDVFMDVLSCSCTGWLNRVLVAAGGGVPSSIDAEVVTFTVPVVNADGGPIAPGSFELFVSVYGEASVHPGAEPPVLPDAGHAGIEVSGAVLSVVRLDGS